MWLGKLIAVDMTPLGSLGRKTTTQTNIPEFYHVTVEGIYPKYLDTLTSYHTYPKIWYVHFTTYWCVKKTARWVANIIEPDQTQHSVVFDLGLPFAQPVCPNTLGKYNTSR